AETATDTAVATDTTTDTTAETATDGGSGQCSFGSLKGVVCAPSAQVFVSLAIVSIDTKDCAGNPVHMQTISQVDGTYYFEHVPTGMQPVHIEKGSFTLDFEVIILPDHLTDISGADVKMCFGAGGASIAIFWGQWDQMDQIVDRLGFDYTWFYYYDTLYAEEPDWEADPGVQLLRDLDAMLDYNILILNCGSAYKKWVEQFPDIVDNLHQWVLLGGSLYLSDLAWVVGERAFPDAIDFWGDDDLEDAQVIEPHSTFDAALVDAALAEYTGAMNLQVTYDSGPLISVSAAGEGTAVHAMGHIQQCTSFWDDCLTDVTINEDQPVLLSYEPGPGSGRVVYSGFHVDEQQDQETYDKVLYYLLFLL
ncbi:MAG: hypothetical protein FJ098_13915, partial [Deltaproteobacteria bacterium]|nr:hypothetical protein [Deltaproteobacteria bacterium]